MYFVVFFLEVKQHRVCPFKWVRGLNYEHIVNNGLDRNRKFQAFWTNNDNAFDEHGVPKRNYIPDPTAFSLAFPNTGWYECKIRKFKGNVQCIILFTS